MKIIAKVVGKLVRADFVTKPGEKGTLCMGFGGDRFISSSY